MLVEWEMKKYGHAYGNWQSPAKLRSLVGGCCMDSYHAGEFLQIATLRTQVAAQHAMGDVKILNTSCFYL
jgi:hypothetical protein